MAWEGAGPNAAQTLKQRLAQQQPEWSKDRQCKGGPEKGPAQHRTRAASSTQGGISCSRYVLSTNSPVHGVAQEVGALAGHAHGRAAVAAAGLAAVGRGEGSTLGGRGARARAAAAAAGLGVLGTDVVRGVAAVVEGVGGAEGLVGLLGSRGGRLQGGRAGQGATGVVGQEQRCEEAGSDVAGE